MKKKRILLSPLDWGLGHASRIVPLVHHFLDCGHIVLLASSGDSQALLRQEFPQLEHIKVPSYDISYARSALGLVLQMFWQLPRVFWSIFSEHQALKQIVAQHNIDWVISDNRYGFYHAQVRSSFITHQLGIILPRPLRPLQKILWALNRWFIARFDELLVPDFQGGLLSGKLSQAFVPSCPVRYLGVLSRFSVRFSLPEHFGCELLVVLSGPEPQRSLLESIILGQLQNLRLSTVLVRGKPSAQALPNKLAHVRVVNFLGSDALQEAMFSARTILCRSGYSSILDLVAIGRSAILVPTPGQTEQEYLAERLKRKGWFYGVSQKKLCLTNAIQQASDYSLPAGLPCRPLLTDL